MCFVVITFWMRRKESNMFKSEMWSPNWFERWIWKVVGLVAVGLLAVIILG